MTIFPRSQPNFPQNTKVSVERLTGRSTQIDIIVKILTAIQNLGKMKNEKHFISATTGEPQGNPNSYLKILIN